MDRNLYISKQSINLKVKKIKSLLEGNNAKVVSKKKVIEMIEETFKMRKVKKK